MGPLSDDVMCGLPMAPDATIHEATGGVLLCHGEVVSQLHPLWIRERLNGPETVDPVSGQRLHEPLDIDVHAAVTECSLDERGLFVEFSDGFRGSMTTSMLDRSLGRGRLAEDPPAKAPWTAADLDVTIVNWGQLDADADHVIESELAALDALFRHGVFIIRNAPTRPGSLREIAGRFGRISATNFGELFDVRTEPVPVDMAYTPVGLSAHTDQPYRQPTPGVQFLHTLVNDASGGDSTIVDGLAAVEGLRVQDPEAFDVLSRVLVEFRYDTGDAVKTNRAPIIELRADGALRQIRFSPRLDFAPLLDAHMLDVYYRGQRWLASALNDAARQITFRLTPGDVLVVDNHRVLHGRHAFDTAVGSRHLQGCYIDHDGPASMWTLAVRSSLAAPQSAPHQGRS